MRIPRNTSADSIINVVLAPNAEVDVVYGNGSRTIIPFTDRHTALYAFQHLLRQWNRDIARDRTMVAA